MHIVIATDGLKASRHALSEALRLIRFSDAHVTVMTAVDADCSADARTAAQADLDAATAQLAAAGVTCAQAIRQGRTADQVVAFARAEKADLLVLGASNKDVLSRVLMGSVSSEILRQWTGAVLLVRTPS